MLKVKLEAKPNHDYTGCDYRGSLNIKARFITVATLKEASEICSAFIEKNELGGGNWTGGQVFENGKEIARVSYNGRIWEPLPFPQSKEIQI